MIYKDDNYLLCHNIVNAFKEDYFFELEGLGRFKNSFWKFQKEWRYVLRFLPIASNLLTKEGFMLSKEDEKKLSESINNGTLSLGFNHYDIRIRKECFQKMSLTLSPDISEGAKMFAEMLIEKYNPDCKIKESVLTGLIK